MSAKLQRNSPKNKDVVLDMWKRLAPEYWTHQMIADEVGLTRSATKKIVQRARKAGDQRAVERPVGKPPW